MRKLGMLSMTVLAVILFLASGCEAGSKNREIILMTEYRQIGWGERYSFGAVDNDGNLYTVSADSWTNIPDDKKELLTWAETSKTLKKAGSIDKNKLEEIKSLIATVSEQPVKPESAACDAGTQTSYACRRGRDGKTDVIVLGMAGDDTYENTDPSAQSLYRFLVRQFPNVTSYEGETIAPAGFIPVGLPEFCGYESADLAKLKITAYENDCETGLKKIKPDKTADEILSMKVTGKANSFSVTGNTVIYSFTKPDGKTAASFEFYKNMLVRPDGMYSVSE